MEASGLFGDVLSNAIKAESEIHIAGTQTFDNALLKDLEDQKLANNNKSNLSISVPNSANLDAAPQQNNLEGYSVQAAVNLKGKNDEDAFLQTPTNIDNAVTKAEYYDKFFQGLKDGLNEDTSCVD